MDPLPNPPDPRLPAPVPRRRRHWLLKTLGVLGLLLLALLVAIPFVASSDWSRDHLTAALREEIGTEVRIDAIDFGWLSGFRLDGLLIGNPKGFDASHPFLRLQSLRCDLGLWQAMRGNIVVAGKAVGLHLFVDQDKDGRTNAEALFPRQPVRGGSGGGGGKTTAPDDELLQRLQVDLALAESTLEIRRDGLLLESVKDLGCRLTKIPGSSRFQLDVDATMNAAGPAPGKLLLHADLDARAMSIDSVLTASGLDLAHYQPLADSFLRPGEASMAGVVHGTVQAHVTGDPGSRRLLVDGTLTVANPGFAGSLLQGMTITAPQWTLTPRLSVALDQDGAPASVDATQFAADLGCLQLRGLDAEVTRTLLGGKDGLGFDCTLDVDALASYGGPMPAQLRNIGGVVHGKVALPLRGVAMPPLEGLLTGLDADATVRLKHLAIGGFDLTNLDSRLRVQNGQLELTTGTGTLLNQGGLQLNLQSDITRTGTMPFGIKLQWQGGKVAGETAALLRYAVPLLAGLQGDAANFTSGIDLSLELQGAARPQTGQSWLQLLNTWQGSGNLALANGEVVPAPALQGLLGFLGQQGKLAIDRLDGGFTLKQGTVESKLMRWVSKGRDYGLTGKVQLDGKLDFGLDVTAMLQQHKDGQKIAAFLGGQKLTAGLAGSLDAPRLGLPDVGKLLTSALQQEAETQLKVKAGAAVQKALDELFKVKKK